MDKKPLVSICCLTYNHRKYINDTIESFLMQKTNFVFEILIHDDASTDGTTEIIKEYEKKYPDLIKPIYQTENQWSKGIKPIFKYLFPKAKGKYIALCEGDDYWTDPCKLQKQVDFLEEHSNFGGMATNALVIKKETQYKFGLKYSRIIKNKELIKSRQFATATFLFRNFNIPTRIFEKAIAGDTLLFLLVNKTAPIYYLDQVTSVYNYGQHGVTSSFKKNKEKLIEFYNLINKLTEYKHSFIVKRKILSIDKNYKFYPLLTKKIIFLIEYIDSIIFHFFLKIFNIKKCKAFDISFDFFYVKLKYLIFKNDG